VVSDSILRKIVGSDFFTSITSADLLFSFLKRLRLVLFPRFETKFWIGEFILFEQNLLFAKNYGESCPGDNRYGYPKRRALHCCKIWEWYWLLITPKDKNEKEFDLINAFIQSLKDNKQINSDFEEIYFVKSMRDFEKDVEIIRFEIDCVHQGANTSKRRRQ